MACFIYFRPAAKRMSAEKWQRRPKMTLPFRFQSQRWWSFCRSFFYSKTSSNVKIFQWLITTLLMFCSFPSFHFTHIAQSGMGWRERIYEGFSKARTVQCRSGRVGGVKPQPEDINYLTVAYLFTRSSIYLFSQEQPPTPMVGRLSN